MEQKLSESVKVLVSEDSMEARLYLSSTPPSWGEDVTYLYTVENIMDILKENGVKAGIDQALLKSVIINKLYDTYHLIAKGRPAVNGTDGYFTYNFKTEVDNKPKVNADGSVDYRNIEMYESVEKDQEVVTYTPATKGSFGYDVKNKFLSCIPGKDQTPLKGEGFYVSEDGNHYYSNLTGKIELGQDNSLRITNTLEIKGDVDMTTGDVVFGGDVIIHGNVMTGTSVRCKGNLTILGNVEEANIYAGGTIEIKAGMQGGSKGSVISDCDVWAKFFESTSVHCKGDFHANSIMNCDVFCEGNIYVTGRFGIIVGGSTTCSGNIEATIIGNLSEVKTMINAGTNPNTITEISALEADIKEDENKLEKLHEVRKKMAQITNPTDAVKFNETLEQIETSITALSAQLKEKTTTLNQKLFLISTYSSSKIIVQKFLYPGVYITINGLHYNSRDTFTNVTLKDTGGQVQVINNF